MKLMLFTLLIVGTLLSTSYASSLRREAMDNNKFENWIELWSDGFELDLVKLPKYISKGKLYEIKDRKGSFVTIGYRRLSPDTKKIAFTIDDHYEHSSSFLDTLYILDVDTLAVKKIGYANLNNGIGLNGFMGNNRLLLHGYMSVDENGMLVVSEKSEDELRYLYVFDLNTKQLEELSNLGTTTVGMSNSKCSGDILAYNAGNSFVVYNVNNKKTYRIDAAGDLIAISPNSHKILFRNDNGDYYLVDGNGQNEELILSKNKTNKFAPSSLRILGGYWELSFMSWSPDGKYILFGESADQNKGRRFLFDVETKEISQIN